MFGVLFDRRRFGRTYFSFHSQPCLLSDLTSVQAIDLIATIMIPCQVGIYPSKAFLASETIELPVVPELLLFHLDENIEDRQESMILPDLPDETVHLVQTLFVEQTAHGRVLIALIDTIP